MADMMDELKMSILNTLLSNAKETAEKSTATQKKRAALLPSFETREEALKYAQRIATLRPGDLVKVINEDDTGLSPAVFVDFDMSVPPSVVVLYYDDDKRLCTGVTALHAVVID